MVEYIFLAINTVGMIAGLAAAVFWFWASKIPVPDNVDTFIAELQRISKVNAWGAIAACIAAVCAAANFFRNLF